jgi:hypothetical protein
MGIDCRVEDEDGGVLNELPDSQSLVAFLLTPDNSTIGQTLCLRFIDEYGDTTFNQLQISVLLLELNAAVLRCTNMEARAHGEKLAALIATAEGEVHTYVKFIGD